MSTGCGRQVYARRKAIVEPVFGQMHTLQNAKHLLLRGLEQSSRRMAAAHRVPRVRESAASNTFLEKYRRYRHFHVTANAHRYLNHTAARLAIPTRPSLAAA